MKTKGTLDLLKTTFQEFMKDECPRMAAALSYYTVFSLPPLMILLLLIAGTVFDPQQVQAAIHEQIGMLMGSAGADEIAAIINQAERPGGRGIKAVLGVGAILFGATGAFIQLQSALNAAWEVEPDPNQGGIRNFIFKRLLSLGMILGIAFLLLVSLGISAALSAMGGALGGFFPGVPEPVLYAVNLAISFVVITALFAAMFKVLPDARIAWRDVWVGAVVTSLLFLVGKFVLGFYLGRSNPGEAFGAAGSLALVLVWIYYSAMILLVGAEFTQTWAVTRGGGIRPESGARFKATEPVDPRDTPSGKAREQAKHP
ncbi:YihY/virulence factor BrkB family protein [Longimicrobium terrae]|uniref:Membrane protein n=1 Tax=Longimicrobium terrae TaxID=1639882 RepID=A0A841H3I6_9BACT|nr:YihY/virulence factor BrkB family protein [Longimicrobium terrae]MBB4638597.1 membrane protein [Longimicrobium terrae]MBB6072765.1 membrane protein [Longimicrobium terrae]NNC30617.1 YihY/virulence factor BrkB family protein [Longimicrobium terrae]